MLKPLLMLTPVIESGMAETLYERTEKSQKTQNLYSQFTKLGLRVLPEHAMAERVM